MVQRFPGHVATKGENERAGDTEGQTIPLALGMFPQDLAPTLPGIFGEKERTQQAQREARGWDTSCPRGRLSDQGPLRGDGF